MMGKLFHVPTPCHNCPFRREGGIRLTRDRVREIALPLLRTEGHTFDCHKTVNYDEGATDAGKRLHCAGALIFAEKNGNATQMMRIMERLGAYDAAALMANADTVAAIFDTVGEMERAAIDRPRGKRRRVVRVLAD